MRTSVLTTIVNDHNAEEWGPDQDQDQLWPAVVIRRGAAGDCKDVVSAWLYDVVDSDAVDGTSKAEQACNSGFPAMFCSAGVEDRPPRVQNFGQIPHDAYQRAHEAKGNSNHELDFKIAETRAVPPVCSIVCRPDEGVDKVHEVGEHDPAYETRCSKIAVPDVPGQRRDVDDKGCERQYGDSNCGREDWKTCFSHDKKYVRVMQDIDDTDSREGGCDDNTDICMSF